MEEDKLIAVPRATNRSGRKEGMVQIVTRVSMVHQIEQENGVQYRDNHDKNKVSQKNELDQT